VSQFTFFRFNVGEKFSDYAENFLESGKEYIEYKKDVHHELRSGKSVTSKIVG